MAQHRVTKTIAEINAKIRSGRVVVVTAEEIIDIVHKKGAKKAAADVDVVTTGTFGPMCSSGAYFNLGHSKPRIKIGGGTCPLQELATWVVSIDPAPLEPDRLEEILRQGSPPVICRISRDRVLFDVRTLLPEEDGLLAACLKAALKKS